MQIFYVNIGGGEPTVRSDFWELVAYATDHHVGVEVLDQRIPDHPRDRPPTGGQRLRGRADLARRRHSGGQRRRPGRRILRHARWRPWNSSPRPDSGFKLSVVVTRHNMSQLDASQALAERYGAQLRLTRLRPSGRGADVWEELHPTAEQQRMLYGWLVANGEDVLTGDSFFHLAGYGEPLPGLNLCGAGRVVCLVDPVGDVYACPFTIHEEFLAGNVRSPGGFAGVWRHATCSPSCGSPRVRGACRSCGHYDACRGGCMAAKFFTGLPLDGPDPECVLGHGERPIGSRGRRPPARPSPDHSRRPRRGAGDPPAPAGPTGPATRARSHRSGPGPAPALTVVRLSDPVGWPDDQRPSRVVFGPHETNLGRGRAIGDATSPTTGRGRGGRRHGGHRDGLGPALGLALRAGSAGRAVRPGLDRGRRGLPPARHPGAGRARPLRSQGSSAYSQSVLWAPSRVADVVSREMPAEMEQADIDDVGRGVRPAAGGRRAGLDGVEIDAGPTSLLRQFHSGLTNQPADGYGTDPLRLTSEVLGRARLPSGPTRVVSLRLCCDELAPGRG